MDQYSLELALLLQLQLGYSLAVTVKFGSNFGFVIQFGTSLAVTVKFGSSFGFTTQFVTSLTVTVAVGI